MGTYEGLALPVNGEFYHYPSAGSTYNWYVESDGVFNLSVDDPGRDNAVALTITDGSTAATGYLQGYYVSITTDSTASFTTGNSQINSFAADLFLGGTISCEAECFYGYIAKSGTPTVTSGNISGMVVYIDDLGGAASSRSGIQIHIADGNAAASQDAFIVMRLEGASGAVTNMFQKSGTATNPTYFLATNATDGMINAGDVVSSGATAQSLVCNINGSVRHIPLYTNS